MIVRLQHPRAVIVEGEALATMRALIKTASIDLVLTDPPYGAHTHANIAKARRNDGGKEAEELWFPPLTREFVNALAVEFLRVAKGWIGIFTDDATVEWWKSAIEAAGGRFVRTCHWVKTNPKPQMSKDRPGVGTEPMVLAHVPGPMKWHGGGTAGVWRGGRDLDAEHPNAKPLWLMQTLAGLFADPGAVVLDPFAGSFSTGIACLAADRFTGMSPLDPGCPKCAKKAKELIERPPMPLGYSFIGIEGHAPTAEKYIPRIAPYLEPGRLAA